MDKRKPTGEILVDYPENSFRFTPAQDKELRMALGKGKAKDVERTIRHLKASLELVKAELDFQPEPTGRRKSKPDPQAEYDKLVNQVQPARDFIAAFRELAKAWDAVKESLTAKHQLRRMFPPSHEEWAKLDDSRSHPGDVWLEHFAALLGDGRMYLNPEGVQSPTVPPAPRRGRPKGEMERWVTRIVCEVLHDEGVTVAPSFADNSNPPAMRVLRVCLSASGADMGTPASRLASASLIRRHLGPSKRTRKSAARPV